MCEALTAARALRLYGSQNGCALRLVEDNITALQVKMRIVEKNGKKMTGKKINVSFDIPQMTRMNADIIA